MRTGPPAKEGRKLLCQPLLHELSRRLTLEPGVDAFDHLAVVVVEAFLGDIAEMRRQHEIVELAERMVDRQRLDRGHVEGNAMDLLLPRGFLNRHFIYNLAARGVVEIGRKLYPHVILS